MGTSHHRSLRNQPPLLQPHTGCFCSAFYEDKAECVDGLPVSSNWAEENSKCFPSYTLIGLTMNHLLLCSTVGALVASYWIHWPVWPLLSRVLCPQGTEASPHVVAIRELGHCHSVLGFPADSKRGAFCEQLIVTIRFDGRNSSCSRLWARLSVRTVRAAQTCKSSPQALSAAHTHPLQGQASLSQRRLPL
jgi:hypothetical protein